MKRAEAWWLLAYTLSCVGLIVALSSYEFDWRLFAALFVNAPVAVMYGYFAGLDDGSRK